MDADLIHQAKSGDRRALAQLLEEIAPLAHRFGLRMCRHEADADEVMQDTLLSVLQNLDGFAGRASFSSWLFLLARTACARRRRGLKNRAHVSEDTAPEQLASAPSPEDAADQKQTLTTVARALDELSDEQREVLVLRDIEGLSAAEVGDVLSLSTEAVKSRLHRARAALRSALGAAFAARAPKPDADCPDVLTALSRKLEGDLASTDCAAMEKHLETCAACRNTCASLRDALALCRSQATGELPDQLRNKIHDCVQTLVARR